MDIVIQTGFEPVEYVVDWQPETAGKGKDLVESDHLRNVQELRKDGKSYLIKCKIIRTTSVNETPYVVQLFLATAVTNSVGSNVRKVKDVSCTCVYRESKKCKHVAALIYFINNVASLTKTDSEQVWGVPSKKESAKDKYSKGATLKKLFSSKLNKRKFPRSFTEPSANAIQLKELEGASTYKYVKLAELKDKADFAIDSFLSSVKKNISSRHQKRQCAGIVRNTMNNVLEYPLYSDNSVLFLKNEEDKQFYNDFIVLSNEQIIDLAASTIDQAKNNLWLQARSLRISSSKYVHIINRRRNKTKESLVNDMLTPKPINNTACKYGVQNEPVARKVFEKTFGVTVYSVGLIISKKQPWLCASGDGAVIENDVVQKLLEIKCPITCKDCPIYDDKTQKINVKYLKMVNGELRLKESHLYYSQIQTIMYITGLDLVDLYVYSPKGSCCVPVYRNETFIKGAVLKCEDFFFNDLLPALQRKYQSGNLPSEYFHFLNRGIF